MTDPRSEKRSAYALWGLVALAAATRLALALRAPRSFGYVWDLYHEGVVWTAVHRALPLPADCGECYHPPLLFACGAPVYALGASLFGGFAGGLRALSWLSMLASAVVVYYSRKTLRLLRPSPDVLLAGTALALVFPALFLASYGAENDVVLAALMTAFFYRLCAHRLHPGRERATDALTIGILAGLAALTKYSGLLAPLTAAAVLAPDLLRARRRARAARDLGLVLGIAALVCGWHYAGNLRRDRRAFLGPPWDRGVFAFDAAKLARNAGRYDFASFTVSGVVDLYRPENAGKLDDFPVYRSVFTTLHALAWTDMSFFSVPSRHGWTLPLHYEDGREAPPPLVGMPVNAPRETIYPLKRVSLGLIAWTLRLGTIPTLLALVGFAATWRRRALRPFAVFAGLSLAVYTVWFLSQPMWALKTKYVLFLLPVYVAYAALGVSAASRRDRRLGHGALAALAVALCVGEAYLLMFALG